MIAKFVIPGEPQGKGRPRFARAGNYVRAYTPEKTVSYENLVKLEYQAQCKGIRFNDNAPLDVRIMAYYGIPKSASKKKQDAMRNHEIRPIKKVDVDNLIKIILDSLNAVAYRDDVQVVDCQIRKFYSDTPRTAVIIRGAGFINNEEATE